MTEPTLDDIIIAGKNLQNKSGRAVGATGTEERAFHEFFGTSPLVATVLWNTMVARDIIPTEGEINHLLWTLHFMKAYPKQGVACSMAGGTNGAIDPKTHRKYMWPFIHAIAELEPFVVSTIVT